VIDVTTTEIADEIGGGVLSAGPGRLDVFARHACRTSAPAARWTWSTSAPGTPCPSACAGRRLHRHNPTVTLMRTTPDECRAIGEFIARKLNAMAGPVRFFIPRAACRPSTSRDSPFHDPDADRALFAAIAAGFRPSSQHRLVRLPLHVNDEAFADALVGRVARDRAGDAPHPRRSTLTCPGSRASPSSPACTTRSRTTGPSSAAEPARACRPSARRPAASTSS
jgi:uncharacterized protein (UPF0261 family)